MDDVGGGWRRWRRLWMLDVGCRVGIWIGCFFLRTGEVMDKKTLVKDRPCGDGLSIKMVIHEPSNFRDVEPKK